MQKGSDPDVARSHMRDVGEILGSTHHSCVSKSNLLANFHAIFESILLSNLPHSRERVEARSRNTRSDGSLVR